jgi:hypothetical protein
VEWFSPTPAVSGKRYIGLFKYLKMFASKMNINRSVKNIYQDMEMHYGQIVEQIIRRKGYSISELARLTKVNRRSVYNWFNQKQLKPEIIFRIGTVVNYDFSAEFPGLFPDEDFSKPNNYVVYNTPEQP